MMLVTKLSNGKYRNENQMYNDVISEDNVKLMGEMVALQVIRNSIPYDVKLLSFMYDQLIKDLHHMNEVRYIISDSYDYAQTAIEFLWQFRGMRASDIYGTDKKGKVSTIKNECFRVVDRKLYHFRKKIARLRFIELNHNKHDIPDPINCFDNPTTDYSKVDAIVETLKLTQRQQEVFEYSILTGNKPMEVTQYFGLTGIQINDARKAIRAKYKKLMLV